MTIDEEEEDSLDTQKIAWIKQLTKQLPRSPAPQADAAAVKRDTHLTGSVSANPPSRLPEARDDPNTDNARRDIVHLGHAIPRLKSSVSAPIKPSTADTAPAHARMYHSFSGFGDGDGPGDTQVMDSQIYREFTTGGTFLVPARTTGELDDRSTQEDADVNGTLQEGDTGHVDLVGHWEENEQNDQLSTYGDDTTNEFSLDPGMQLRKVQTSEMHFVPPQTPATASRKRNRQGEVVSSETRTPGSAFANLFNNGTGIPMLSMSQLFNASQGASSPQLDGPRSDPIFQRPSPGFNMRFSSPNLALSSPTKNNRSDPYRAATEPRDTYTTMKESQERREVKKRLELEAKLAQLEAEGFDDFDDERTVAERKADIRKIKAQLDESASKERASLDAQSNGLMLGKKIARHMSDTALFTPIRSKKDRGVVEVDNDVPEDKAEHSLDELSPPPPTAELQGRPQSVQVPMTSSRPHHSSGSELRNGVRSIQEGANDITASQANSSRRRTKQTVQNHISQASQEVGGSDNVAVADSQPGSSQAKDNDHPPSELPELSSLDARVAQSQYSTNGGEASLGVEGRMRRAINTSSAPKPPSSQVQALVIPDKTIEEEEEDDNEVPSSPPIMVAHIENDEAGEAEVDNGSEEREQPDGETDEQRDDNEGLDFIADNDNYDKPDLSAILFGSSQAYIEHSDEAQEDEEEQADGDGDAPVDEQGESAEQQDENDRDDAARMETRPQPPAKLQHMHSTIPETDPIEQDDDENDVNLEPQQPQQEAMDSSSTTSLRSRPESKNTSAEKTTYTDNSRDFSTAQTHVSVSASPSRPLTSQPKSQLTPVKSPVKRSSQRTPRSTRVRKLTDIAQDASQVQQPLEDMDLDFLAENIMNEGDKEFQRIMSDIGSSPVRPPKRRKVYSARALRESPKKANRIHSPSPARGKEKTAAVDSPESDDPSTTGVVEEEAIFTKPAIMKNHVSGKLTRPTARRYGRRNSTTAHDAAARKTAQRVLEVAETPQTRQPVASRTDPSAAAEVTADVPVEEEEPQPRQTRETEAAEQEQVPSIEEIPNGNVTDKNSTEVQSRDILTPNRVLAWFRGGPMVYYPATCVGLTPGDNFRYHIRFDDGTVDNIERYHVRSFDLRDGDLVKVDLPKMRTKTYVVRGFKDIILTEEAAAVNSMNDDSQQILPPTDIHGARSVILEVKQRDSLSSEAHNSVVETVEVPIASIYITSSMWSRFKDRPYVHPSEALPKRSRLVTPSSGRSAPGTPTTTKSRRQPPSALEKSVQTSIENWSTPRLSSDGLFSGMAFAVTFTAAGSDAERDEVMQLITDNGGRILDVGFDVLFHVANNTDVDSALETSDIPPTGKTPSKTPKKSATNTTTNTTSDEQGLLLTTTSRDLGFTALISDRHSRRTKYMQALALGLPCLSSRWIRDSVSANAVKPWEHYLLPAGESAYLGGAVRSRTDLSTYYDATDDGSGAARLERVLQRRQKLLEGKSVLLVMGRSKSKGKEDRRRAYEFLTRAMGARRVGRCNDVREARKMLEEEDEEGVAWDWVYVDGGEGEVERALMGEVEGNGEGGGERGRKRKRGSTSGGGGSSGTGGGAGAGGATGEMGVRLAALGNGRSVRVVNDEFVIQSLILGTLLEE